MDSLMNFKRRAGQLTRFGFDMELWIFGKPAIWSELLAHLNPYPLFLTFRAAWDSEMWAVVEERWWQWSAKHCLSHFESSLDSGTARLCSRHGSRKASVCSYCVGLNLEIGLPYDLARQFRKVRCVIHKISYLFWPKLIFRAEGNPPPSCSDPVHI